MFGAAIAILCAFTWSVSIILFKKSGDQIHPILLNLCKNLLALILIIPTTLLIDGMALPHIAPTDLALLLASGFVGIGLSDAMVLRALSVIGASRIAIVECTYAPFVIFLSVTLLGEAFTMTRLVGILLVIAALLCVSFSGTRDETISRARLAAGFRWGILGLFSMAAGIVLIKPLFDRVPLFWIIGIRLGSGVVASTLVFLALRRKRDLLADLVQAERKALIFAACFLSTYIAMILWVAGYKYNDATIAAVLNQMSTFFTVILAALVLKERLTPAKVAGTVLAVGGVLVMTLT